LKLRRSFRFCGGTAYNSLLTHGPEKRPE